MDYQIKGKLAFLTAGAHGIGEAIANLLAQEGFGVIVADQDEAALQAKGGTWVQLSPRIWRPRKAWTVGAFGRAPDILVNNLGLADPIPFESFSDEQWTRAVDINLMGCVRTCRALLPKMAALGSASVVNIASDVAKQPEPGLMAYGACKAALLHVTKNLAKEYAPKIRVNAVSPGPVWTRLWTRAGGIVDQLVVHYGVDKDAAVKRFLEERYMPLGIGQPDSHHSRQHPLEGPATCPRALLIGSNRSFPCVAPFEPEDRLTPETLYRPQSALLLLRRATERP